LKHPHDLHRGTIVSHLLKDGVSLRVAFVPTTTRSSSVVAFSHFDEASPRQ
jgi:lambda repressor-like predicted transcriptional regulator